MSRVMPCGAAYALAVLLFSAANVSWALRSCSNWAPRSARGLLQRHMLTDDSIDLTPELNGKVLKRVLRRGDLAKGRAVKGDTLFIGWKMFNSTGSLVHSTQPPSQAWLSDTQTEEEERQEEPPFDFELGAEPREVIRGWELGVATMLEGEIASFEIDAEYAFGAKGVDNLVRPGERMRTEVELYRIVASAFRKYERLGPDENIRDELMDKIQRGDSPLSNEALQRGPVSGTVRSASSFAQPPKQAEEGFEYVEELSYVDVSADNQVLGRGLVGDGDGIAPAAARIPVAPPVSTPSARAPAPAPAPAPPAAGTKAEAGDEAAEPPQAPLLPDNAQVTGEGRGHSWSEDSRTLDVFLPLPGPVSKRQLSVSVEKARVCVTLALDDGSTRTLLEGPLRGSVRASATTWALLPPDSSASYKGERLWVSLEKAHGSTTIWASVLDPAFLSSSLPK